MDSNKKERGGSGCFCLLFNFRIKGREEEGVIFSLLTAKCWIPMDVSAVKNADSL